MKTVDECIHWCDTFINMRPRPNVGDLKFFISIKQHLESIKSKDQEIDFLKSMQLDLTQNIDEETLGKMVYKNLRNLT